jgi:hypothetical protein
MVMICFHTKFHTHISDVSSAIAIKPITKTQTPCSRHVILHYTEICLNEVASFSKIYYYTHFSSLNYAALMPLPTHKFLRLPRYFH